MLNQKRLHQIMHSPHNSYRQNHLEIGPDTRLAIDKNRAAVKLGDAFDYRESDAVALRGVGQIALVEAVENVVDYLLVHAAAVVPDLKYYLGAVGVELDLDFSALRRELDRVFDQVDPHLV